MVVESMTQFEVIKEMKKDFHFYNHKVNILKLYKSAKRKQLKGLDNWFIWKSPNRNNYYIKFLSKKETIIFLYVNKLAYTFIGDFEEFNFENLVTVIRTKHFFDRYNERFLKKELSTIDIIKHFFVIEKFKHIEEITPDNCLSKFKSKPSDDLIVVESQYYSTNGVQLGYAIVTNDDSKGFDTSKILINTFVSTNMFHKAQRFEIEKAEKLAILEILKNK